MPIDSPASLGLIYQSALAAVRSAGTDAELGRIARRLFEQGSGGPNAAYIDILNVVMAADRNWRQASVYVEYPTQVVPAREIPIDPTIPAGAPRFAYRVVVTQHMPDGTKEDTVTTVRLDEPAAGWQIQAMAIGDVQAGVQESDTNPRQHTDSIRYTAVIVSAGRARG